MRRTLEVLSIVVGLSRPTAGQTAASIPTTPHLFLERGYFAPGNPVGKRASSLLFEGEAATHYFLFNTMDWEWTHSGGWRFAMPVSFIPVVRMSTSVSSPVLTPSYKIRPIWLQAIHLSPESRDSKAFSLWSIAAGVMHYSNGQDGCTYQGYVRDTTAEGEPCVVAPHDSAIAKQGVPNTRDGDFSTTFFPIAWNRRWGRLADTSLQVAYQQSVNVEIEINPLGMIPGGLDRGLALEYGRHQINLGYEFEKRLGGAPGIGRISLRSAFRTQQDTGKTWSSQSIEIAREYENHNGFGWFIRATFGGDYYNIHFAERSNPLITFGAMWDQNRLDVYNHIGRPVP